jgi:hypothetical protein
VFVFLAVTLTPGTADWLSSTTLPSITPVSDCAHAERGVKSRTRTALVKTAVTNLGVDAM